MTHYQMSDVAVEVNDRENNPASSKYDRFVGLEHYVSGEVIIRNYGSTENLESTMKIFQNGDVLVARRNVYLKRASMVDFDGLTSGDSIVLRAKNPVIGRILPFVLNTDAFWDFADQYSDGTMSKRLSPKTLMTYEFDLPDEDELEKFADLLWAANDARESYHALLRQTDELVKSQFIELFGDYKTNTKNWPIAKFTDFAIIDATMSTDYVRYADYPHIGIDSIEKETGVLSGYRTVKEDNVISGKYVFTSAHIIYSKIRPNLNKVALPDFEGMCSADAYPILPIAEKCDRIYLAVLMRSQFFLDYILGFSARSNMPKVNRKQVEGFTAPLPPLPIQKEFSEFFKQTDKSKFEIKKAIENTSALIKSLMQQDLST